MLQQPTENRRRPQSVWIANNGKTETSSCDGHIETPRFVQEPNCTSRVGADSRDDGEVRLPALEGID